MQFRTRAIHVGQEHDPATGAVVPPIHLASTFVQPDASMTSAYDYARTGSPTRHAFEKTLADLDGGVRALAFASGMAATHCATLLLAPGDEIVTGTDIYGGTWRLFNRVLAERGIAVQAVNAADTAAVARAVGPKTKLVWVESPGNPLLTITDIAACAEIAHAAGALLACDATLTTPALSRPLELGADIVMHSATKFLGGHGTTMGGVIVESGKFNWGHGKFAGMTEPSKGYHGVRFYETFGDFGFTMKCRMEGLRTFGPALSPMNAFLLLQGVETLHLRMERHCSNTLRIAQFLSEHPKVSWVNYPGLANNRYHALAQKYLPKGAGAVLSFGIKGGAAAGQRFIEQVEFLSHLANIGDAKTLVIHPASTTHRQLSEEQQIAAGVPPDLIRLAVGIESVDDILWDIDQALSKT
jgi:O-acetylhomoserine (thiol)-lyase